MGEPRISDQVRRETAALADRLLAAVDRGELSAPSRLIRLLTALRDVASPGPPRTPRG